ncbi:MAG TPA: PadR family transcriptional regulator [Thermoplasmata archaeon]|nr:PadR family transcriptional regulator [Thermoplasmata archaeon]
MMRRETFGGTYHFLAKGDFAGLLLVVLQEKPMHGYETMKALEDRFHGFYKPSAGAIYPALRSLQRRGLVSVTGGERRKTYRITAAGRARLREVHEEVESRFKALEKTMGPERAAMFREFRKTGQLLRTNIGNVTPGQAKELQLLMAEMRERIMKILAE